jgi:hypothetical protein
MVRFGCILALGCELGKDPKSQSIVEERDQSQQGALNHHHEGEIKSILQLSRLLLLQEISNLVLPGLLILYKSTPYQRVTLKVIRMKNGLK